MFFDHFLENQLATWQTAKNNYERLKYVLYRTIDFDCFQIRIQHNPDRILSAVAKIDEASLKARACFLCKENMPPEQQSYDYNPALDIRVNPYPIFSRHYTVPAKQHIPQLISGHLGDMLDIARTYPEYTIFYNGPRSGASAPDHFHFQLAPRHEMPLETDVVHCHKETLLTATDKTLVVECIENYIRKNILIRSGNKELLEQTFANILDIIGKVTPNDPEPMMNLFAWYEGEEWQIVIFPRRQHRPWQFFAEGADNILFSPGCVDFAGLIISPREADFNRLDAPLLQDLFGQLTLTDEEFNHLRSMISQYPKSDSTCGGNLKFKI